jgi:hypothetical protein
MRHTEQQTQVVMPEVVLKNTPHPDAHSAYSKAGMFLMPDKHSVEEPACSGSYKNAALYRALLNFSFDGYQI